MAAYLGYTLWMKTLFRGWPVMAHTMHTRRRRRINIYPSVDLYSYLFLSQLCHIKYPMLSHNQTMLVLIIIILLIFFSQHQKCKWDDSSVLLTVGAFTVATVLQFDDVIFLDVTLHLTLWHAVSAEHEVVTDVVDNTDITRLELASVFPNNNDNNET